MRVALGLVTLAGSAPSQPQQPTMRDDPVGLTQNGRPVAVEVREKARTAVSGNDGAS